MSAFARNCCCIAKALEPYINCAVLCASGLIAASQRSSMSSSVTTAGSHTMELSQRISLSRSGLSVNSCSRRRPSLGLGLKIFGPTPPMVTSLVMRSGCLIARLMPTTPPIELPTTAAEEMPRPSMKRITEAPAVRTGCPGTASLTPKPGNSRT
ncbi:Uncharacterised protein [Mycobacteroides abscessus subsp. abscessus]|nr:Uncharacterised protein [Mycobacteroides abscessus subsp. abscessus]